MIEDYIYNLRLRRNLGFNRVYGILYKNGHKVNNSKEGKYETKYYIKNYINGKKEGEYKLFYENGEIREIILYENGLKHGESKTFYETGEIYSNIKYKYDDLIKEFKYYKSGQIRCIEYCRFGNDTVIHFYKNGKINGLESRTELFSRHGLWINFYENSKVKSVQQYSRGTLMKSEEFYY